MNNHNTFHKLEQYVEMNKINKNVTSQSGHSEVVNIRISLKGR